MVENWYTSKEIKKILGISPQHLYMLRKTGKINSKKVTERKYLFQLPSGFDKETKENIAIYARVSTTKQKKDLDNQINLLKKYVVSNGNVVKEELVFKDIASGMNENRSGFNDLIDKVLNKDISTIIISNRDRLTRFGYGYFESLFKKFGVKIIEVNASDEQSFQNELTNDLIAIIHHFSMKFYGKRKNTLKKIEKDLESCK